MTCRVDNDCFLGHICLSNSCRYGCRQDDDCRQDEICKNNYCKNPCANDIDPCGPNAYCSVVDRKAVCSCSEGLIPNPTPNIGCIRSLSLSCQRHTDCGEGLRCEDNRCRPACTTDGSECLEGERCNSGVCQYACTSDAHCSEDEVCDGRICVTGCRTNSHCPSHLACMAGQCLDPCTEPGTCGANALCVTKDNRPVCTCPQYLEGDPKVVCKRVTTACDIHNNCPDGFSCYGDVCYPSCRRYNNEIFCNFIIYFN